MPRPIEPQMYPFYDPNAQAYRSVSVEDAKLLVESAKKVEAALIEDGELPGPQA